MKAVPQPPAAPPIPGVKPAAPAGGNTDTGAAVPGSSFQTALARASGEGAPLPGRKPVPPLHPAMAEIVQATQQVAGLSGHSYKALLAQATVESRLNPAARNRNSSAAGPFQFLERTWLDLMRRHGPAYGLGDLTRQIQVRNGVPVVRNPAVRQQILGLRHDVNLSAGMAGRYMAEGREALARKLGRKVTETESRIAYVLGVGGASRLIKLAERSPGTIAANLMPNAARANKSLFFDRSGDAYTVAEALSNLKRRMENDHRSMFAAIQPDSGAATAIEYDGPARNNNEDPSQSHV